MAIQCGNIVFIGRSCGLVFYKSRGQYLVRKVSSLTGKRVKKDKRFRRTMEYSGYFGRASKIGSFVYKCLPKTFRQHWMYREFTGEAMQWIMKGKTNEETTQILWQTYAAIWVEKGVTTAIPTAIAPDPITEQAPAQESVSIKLIQVSSVPSFNRPYLHKKPNKQRPVRRHSRYFDSQALVHSPPG